MASIASLLARAAALRDETALNSISPERAGGIMYDTLLAMNELWLQQGAALVISKIYASVAAMNADNNPVSDLTGQPLRPGMIVVIASSDADNGHVYRYNGTSSPRWSDVGLIGNIDPIDSLDSDSATIPLAAHQGKVLDGKISQLGQELNNNFGKISSVFKINDEDWTLADNYYSVKKAVKKGDIIAFNLFWGQINVAILQWSASQDISDPITLARTVSATIMTSNVALAPNDGYIYARSYNTEPETHSLSIFNIAETPEFKNEKSLVKSNGIFVGDIPGNSKPQKNIRIIPLSNGSFNGAGIDISGGTQVMCTPLFEVVDGVIDLHYKLRDVAKYAISYITLDENFNPTPYNLATSQLHTGITTDAKYVRIRFIANSGYSRNISDFVVTTGIKQHENGLEYATDIIPLTWEGGLTPPSNGSNNDNVNYQYNVRTPYFHVEAGKYKLAIDNIDGATVNVIVSPTGVPSNGDGTLLGAYTSNTEIVINEPCYIRLGSAGAMTVFANIHDWINNVQLFVVELFDVEESIFKKVRISFQNNYTINNKGDVYAYSNQMASGWMHGAGVYKINNKARNGNYKLCLSKTGIPSVYNYSLITCRSIYFLVPPETPYWRIGYASSHSDWEILKVKDLKGVADVSLFGAKGDGVTDDTLAIQDALDYAAFVAGGEVYFDNKTYLLSTLQTFDNVTANLIIPARELGEPSFDAYDPNTTYNKDAYATNDGKKWICNEDNVTGEFDSSKWIEFSKELSRANITLRGHRGVRYTSFNAGTGTAISVDMNRNANTLLKSTSDCTINDGTNDVVSVLACGYNDTYPRQFSPIAVTIKDMAIKTACINGYSKLSGVNMGHAVFACIENICVFSNVNIYETFDNETGDGYLQESGHVSTAIIMPNIFCDPMSRVYNSAASGAFTIGFLLGDCQDINGCYVGLCRYAYVHGNAGHPSICHHNYAFNCNYPIADGSSVLKDYIGDSATYWRSNTNYVVDQIVLRYGIYYKCITAHTSGNTFDASQFNAIKIYGFFVVGGSLISYEFISLEGHVARPSGYNSECVVYDYFNLLKGDVKGFDPTQETYDTPKIGGQNVNVTLLT